jgi:hypothetical protein
MLFQDFLFVKNGKITFVSRKDSRELLTVIFETLSCYEWTEIPCYLPNDNVTYCYRRSQEDISGLGFDYDILEKSYFEFAFSKERKTIWYLTEEETKLFKKCLSTAHHFLNTIPYLIITEKQRNVVTETFNFLSGIEKTV